MKYSYLSICFSSQALQKVFLRELLFSNIRELAESPLSVHPVLEKKRRPGSDLVGEQEDWLEGGRLVVTGLLLLLLLLLADGGGEEIGGA